MIAILYTPAEFIIFSIKKIDSLSPAVYATHSTPISDLLYLKYTFKCICLFKLRVSKYIISVYHIQKLEKTLRGK